MSPRSCLSHLLFVVSPFFSRSSPFVLAMWFTFGSEGFAFVVVLIGEIIILERAEVRFDAIFVLPGEVILLFDPDHRLIRRCLHMSFWGRMHFFIRQMIG
uniref:Uncharacterized protein n=1 Tax=Rhizophora mucronata TaxID=61149 RepID=A0A2P2MKS2_RHIMU